MCKCVLKSEASASNQKENNSQTTIRTSSAGGFAFSLDALAVAAVAAATAAASEGRMTCTISPHTRRASDVTLKYLSATDTFTGSTKSCMRKREVSTGTGTITM